MPLKIIDQDAANVLLGVVAQHDDQYGYGAFYFRCSKLERAPTPQEILLSLPQGLRGKQGAIYFFHDGDLLITWNGSQKSMLDDLRARLYAHFFLTGNEALHTYYDFHAQKDDLRQLCERKITALTQAQREAAPVSVQPSAPPALNATPGQLAFFRSLVRTRAQRKQPEILVVEDQPFSSKLLVGLLQQVCRTYAALNAQTALDLYLAHAPDIVFLDIEMPGINGHDLAAMIQRLDKDAYIIMVTANHYTQDVNRAKQNNVKGFVVKPYSKQKIFEGIEKYILTHQAIKG